MQQVSTLDLESVAFPYQIGCGLAGGSTWADGRGSFYPLQLQTSQSAVFTVEQSQSTIYPLLLEKNNCFFIHSAIYRLRVVIRPFIGGFHQQNRRTKNEGGQTKVHSRSARLESWGILSQERTKMQVGKL